MKNTSAQHDVSHRYETALCVFLLAAVFLYRDNAHLRYPEILYYMAGLLIFNLAAGWLLRRWPTQAAAGAAIAVGNCAIITGILTVSGGPDSNLWVLYLLPIYTVCMMLNGFELVIIVTGIISFNAVFQLLAADRAIDGTAMFNLSVKTGLFVFAAAASWQTARKDRRNRARLEDHRREMERMESRLEQQAPSPEVRRMADIGQVASGIAHDIAGPLTVVIGTVRVLLEDDSVRNFRTDLERIHRAAQLCETISSNVLSFARSQEVATAPCDLRTVVDAALQIYEPLLRDRGIEVEKTFASRLPAVNACSAQLERVVLNLLSNARGAMPDGGRVRITVGSTAPRPYSPPWVEIVVEDTGPGVSPEALAKIFKPFNTTKAPGEGTGLGLYVCRQIAVDHKGRLHVENRDEGGARFILSIPCASNEIELAAA